MLAEKFFLVLETLKSHTWPDGSPRVTSTSPHVPVKLPAGNLLALPDCGLVELIPVHLTSPSLIFARLSD
jgi:hypothetical protein